jgi:hypothetical protein
VDPRILTRTWVERQALAAVAPASQPAPVVRLDRDFAGVDRQLSWLLNDRFSTPSERRAFLGEALLIRERLQRIEDSSASPTSVWATCRLQALENAVADRVTREPYRAAELADACSSLVKLNHVAAPPQLKPTAPPRSIRCAVSELAIPGRVPVAARGSCQRVIAREIQQVQTKVNRATRAGDSAAVQRLLDYAIQLAPDSSAVHRQRALAKAKIGDYTGAVQELRWWRDSFGDESADRLASVVMRDVRPLTKDD